MSWRKRFAYSVGIIAGVCVFCWVSIILSGSIPPKSDSPAKMKVCPLRITPAVGVAEVFEETTVIPYAFVIHNDGDAPITIDSIRASCSCTVPSFESGIIPPRGTLDFKVLYHATSIFGELPKRDIRVLTDYAACQQLSCKISGIRRRRFNITPQTIDFGTLKQGETPKAKVHIKALGDDMHLVPESTIFSNLPVLVEILSHNKEDDGECLTLEVSVSRESPIGTIDGYIFVPRKEDDGVGPMFYVYGNVKGEIESVPNKVLFGVCRDDAPRTRFVRLVNSDKENEQTISDIRVISAPDGINVVFKGYEGGFGLTINPMAYQTGLREGQIIVAGKVNGQEHSIAIPFIVNIKHVDVDKDNTTPSNQ